MWALEYKNQWMCWATKQRFYELKVWSEKNYLEYNTDKGIDNVKVRI